MDSQLNSFKRAQELNQETFKLFADGILVERMEEEDIKTSGGIYVAKRHAIAAHNHRQISMQADLPEFVRVLLVGEGYYQVVDGEEEHTPVSAKPGDIILVGRQSVAWFSIFGEMNPDKIGSIGITREDQIKIRFDGYDAYLKFFHDLKASSGESS